MHFGNVVFIGFVQISVEVFRFQYDVFRSLLFLIDKYCSFGEKYKPRQDGE